MPHYSKALIRIYDAAANSAAWQQALDAVIENVGARAGCLQVRNFAGAPYTLTGLCSAYVTPGTLDKIEFYAQHLSYLETPQWEFVARMPPGEIGRDEAMGIPKEELDRRADYVFRNRHWGTQRSLAFRLNDNKGWFDGVILGFDDTISHIPDGVIEDLRPLLPHMAKSVEMGRTFTGLQQRYNAVLAMLDKVALGLVLVQENGEIVIANREAERIISLQDGVARSFANRLALRDADETAQLQAHVAIVARTAAGEGQAAERMMRVTRPSGRHPFLIEVMPLSDSRAELERNLRGAMVVLVDPDNQSELNIASFGTLHHLTPAETEVCGLMILGHPAPEIAEIRGTRLPTARNQIAAVYQKTGTNRRGDLIRLVIRTLPPIL